MSTNSLNRDGKRKKKKKKKDGSVDIVLGFVSSGWSRRKWKAVEKGGVVMNTELTKW